MEMSGVGSGDEIEVLAFEGKPILENQVKM